MVRLDRESRQEADGQGGCGNDRPCRRLKRHDTACNALYALNTATDLMQPSFVTSSQLSSLIPVVVTILVTAILVVLVREQGRTVAMI